jgi:hypothetical protein
MFTIVDIPLLDEKVQHCMSALVKHVITSQSCNCSGGHAAITLAYSQCNTCILQKQHDMMASKQQKTENCMNDL